MTVTQNNPLGFETALRVVKLGRSAFFPGPKEDKPKTESPQITADDLLPQFGYVGSRYESRRILFWGINPGSGPRDERNEGDEILMPALEEFTAKRTTESFLAAQDAYKRVCEQWLVQGGLCNELFQAGGIGMEDIAYTNALPWRIASGSRFAKKKKIARQAAALYVGPVVDELRPSIIVAVGKSADDVLRCADIQPEVVWNRERAPRPSVKKERDDALKDFKSLVQAQDHGAR